MRAMEYFQTLSEKVPGLVEFVLCGQELTKIIHDTRCFVGLRTEEAPGSFQVLSRQLLALSPLAVSVQCIGQIVRCSQRCRVVRSEATAASPEGSAEDCFRL